MNLSSTNPRVRQLNFELRTPIFRYSLVKPLGGLLCILSAAIAHCEEWPGWRGPRQDGVSEERDIPTEWSSTTGIAWQCEIPGEGSSSPVVWQERIFITSASRGGGQRWLIALNARSGEIEWNRELIDENPEYSSPLTGHAASTPVTDGKHVYAWFGNAGLVCFDFDGNQIWHRKLGEFETELGLASSPVIHGELLYLLCDHDGDRFRTFDSFLVAINRHTGDEQWRAERPRLFRSWTTPVVNAEQGELIVAGDKQLRAYDLANGAERWHAEGLLEWVAPTPSIREGIIISMCGRNGPILAIHSGELRDSSERVIWQHATGGSYVCSPLVYGDYLYVQDERGILACYDLKTGDRKYQQRLEGTFYSSPVAADGHIYISNESGSTFVVLAGPTFMQVAHNRLEDQMLGSPAISNRAILIRTSKRLFCIRK